MEAEKHKAETLAKVSGNLLLVAPINRSYSNIS